MRSSRLTLCVHVLWIWPAAAQPSAPRFTRDIACADINLEILDKVATGQLSEAEAVAFRALTSKEHAQEQRCVWITLHNMAVVRALSGRLAEAEVLEEQSLRILDKVFPLDDRVRLRPLYLLWSVQSQQQERAKARQTFRAMQSLRLESPEDQAKFHSAAAGQLHAERQLPEAEAEYRRAFAAWGKAGRADTMDVSSLLVTLATLQIDQDRFLEAGKSLDRALAIVQSAPEAVPLDLINVLRIRAILKARQGKWQAAAEDLGSAMSMSDRDVRLDPAVQKLMLDDFAYILRKAHRSKEARSIEARAKAIHATGSTNAVVDVSELDGSRKAIRK